MAGEHIDLTTVRSDSDESDAAIQTPQRHRHSQPQSQPGSRSRKPISPQQPNRPPTASVYHDNTSIQAASSPRPSKGSAQKPTIHDTKTASFPMRPSSASKHSVDLTSPSSHHPPVGHRTPKHQTPRKVDWTTDKVEESLRQFSDEIGSVAANLTSCLIHNAWKKDAPEPRFISKKDWFADMKRTPVDGGTKSSDTMRIKTKQVGQGRSGKQEKREHFRVICIKTNQEPTPHYSFHHVEIRKNILSPNTMLTYVPHLRDLADNEEGVYRRWLENLENMDKTSGFATLSRHQKVVKTIQKERATTLLEHLDTWLERLAIDNCTKSTLIRHMANQSDAVTPQQKSSILHSYNAESGSPRSAKAVRMFTEAFDRVFDSQDLREHAVPLRDVLLLDKSVDTIVDSKKWMKDTPSQAKVAEEQTTVESFLETYALLGCLVCTSHSCEHGEYGVDNERKRFSIEVVGGLTPMIRQQIAQRLQENGGESVIARNTRTPCGADCYLNGQTNTRARGWNENETMLLRAFYINFEKSSIPVPCATAVATGRPCWDVKRQLNKLDLSLPTVAPPPAVQVKPLQWYDRKKKMLLGDWQEHTNTHEHQRKEHFDPCNHDGPCDKNCACVQNHVMCERFCRCTAATCANKFTGCACHSLGKTCVSKQKDRPCICVQLNRECDPALCGSCGASERAMPKYADNEMLHATGCQNCPLQRGKSKSVVLGKSRIAGYGLFTTEDIGQDEFVIEYVGELISQDEGVRREARRGDVFDETSNSSYLFTLLEQEGIWVDAAIYGNLSRYINHQESNCNVTPRIMYVNGEYRIKFTSLREIKAGEELFFHYGENFPNLTKKLLQEEKAEKKRRKAKEQAATAGLKNGERVKKKPGRKPTGRKPGRPPKKKKKTFAKIDSEPEDDAVEDVSKDPSEDPFPIIDFPKPRKRKRGGIEDDDSDEEEYRPDFLDSQDDTQSGTAASRSQSRFRKRLGNAKARKSFPSSRGPPVKAAANSNVDEDPSGVNESEITPRRRGRKARKLTEDEPNPAVNDELEAEIQPIVMPKKRGRPRNPLGKFIARKDKKTDEVVVGSNQGSARGGVQNSAPDSGQFKHTEARLELNMNGAAVDEGGPETPSRLRHRRQANNKEVLDSSPLSTPDSDSALDYLEQELSDYDSQPRRKGRAKKSASGDDEYNGNSWSDSDGVRHHGALDYSDDDVVPSDRVRRRRKLPARYDD